MIDYFCEICQHEVKRNPWCRLLGNLEVILTNFGLILILFILLKSILAAVTDNLQGLSFICFTVFLNSLVSLLVLCSLWFLTFNH